MSEAPQPALTALPRVDDLPAARDGYDRERVREAFDAFRRHTAQLQAQLRVLQAAGRTASVDPTGHAVRMDALHLIRAAAEFADTLERDAQNASAAQLGKTEEEVRRRQHELQAQEADLQRYRQETERQRTEILSAANKEARKIVSQANAEAKTELREAEARGARLLEQARHQATDLTNATRAEVEQTLEWARAQGAAILARAQHGAEQLLASAGLGEAAAAEVAETIVRAATAVAGPPPGAEPAAPEGRGHRTGARHVPGTDEEEDASTPDDGSGHQADR
jgi:F0F1-type ATP synthase membrane subunit b/b'